jgi:hypothetical protein
MPHLERNREFSFAPNGAIEMSSKDASASHWLQRAAQTRAKANRTRDAAARERLIKMAEEYDLLAEQAQRLLTGLPSMERPPQR